MERHENDMVDNVHNLEGTGMTRAQAEAMVKVMQNMLTEATSHLATRAELAEKTAATEERIAGVERQIAGIEKQIAATERHITLLVSFSTLAIVTAMIGAVVFG